MRKGKRLDEVGGAICYPFVLYHVTYLEEVTFTCAVEAVAAVAPNVNLGFLSAAQTKVLGDKTLFLNQLAVCVEVTSQGSIAIYHHDGVFYKIRVVRRSF